LSNSAWSSQDAWAGVKRGRQRVTSGEVVLGGLKKKKKKKNKGTSQSCSAQDLRMFMFRLTSISGDLDGTNGKASGETAETP
jgi:hypothetical protein